MVNVCALAANSAKAGVKEPRQVQRSESVIVLLGLHSKYRVASSVTTTPSKDVEGAQKVVDQYGSMEQLNSRYQYQRPTTESVSLFFSESPPLCCCCYCCLRVGSLDSTRTTVVHNAANHPSKNANPPSAPTTKPSVRCAAPPVHRAGGEFLLIVALLWGKPSRWPIP